MELMGVHYITDAIEVLKAQTGMKEQENIIKERERRVAEARKLNLLSNTFMTVALDDKLACQHVLRVVTGIADLEIQRSETIDHARRTRFYGFMIDSEYLAKGKDYDEFPEVHIIYISETDLWKAGKTTDEVEKYFKGTNVKYDDGIHVVYVNAEVDDGTAVAQLMQYFKTANPQDMSRGSLSERVHFLKCEEGGYEIICELSEKWMAEGEEKKSREIAFNLASRGMSVENIADIVSMKASFHIYLYGRCKTCHAEEKMNIVVVKQWLEGAAAK